MVSIRNLFLFALIIVLVIGSSGVKYSVKVVDLYSTSPRNPFLTGTSAFYEELEKRGYRVSFGRYRGDLYVVIGPDKTLPQDDVKFIVERFRQGRLSILVADETGIMNGLLVELAGIKISGKYLRWPRGDGVSSLIVPISCLGRIVFSTKVSYIVNIPEDARILCSFKSREGVEYPVAVLVERGSSKLLVVADSSIFANFLYRGYRGLGPSKWIALSLFSHVASPRHKILFEDRLYEESIVVKFASIGFEIVEFTTRILGGLSSEFSEISTARWIIVSSFISTITSIYILGFPPRRATRDKYLEKYTLKFVKEYEKITKKRK